jgi:folate-binding protein YgfZ
MPDDPRSGPEAEVRACRAIAGLFDLPGAVVVRVSGADAADYLHRRLSRSVTPSAPGSAIHACLLGGDGRMLSDIRLLVCAPDDFLLFGEPCVADSLAAQIDRFVILEDLVVEDMTRATGALALDGPKVQAILGEAAGVPSVQFADGRCVRATVAGVAVWCAAMRTIGMPGALVLCPSRHLPEVRSALLAAVVRSGGAQCGADSRRTLRIENGVPQFGVDMDQTTIPLEAGLTHCIDFDKGCFPGQEVVARIHNLGHPAKVLVGFLLDAEELPAEGEKVFAGERAVGWITSVARSPSVGRLIALGYVKWDLREPGTRIEVAGPAGNVPAVVAALPFVPAHA